MTLENKPLVLVDGSSYLYRAFHAMPALMNSKGFPTGATYGMINMLKRLLTDYADTEIVIVFDAKGKTFRDDLYPAYKANRQAMPPALVEQIPVIHRAIAAMGLPIVMIEGVEADDVIGTMAAIAAKQDRKVIISTGDKDLAQLVNAHISLINTMSNSFLDPTGVKEKFGVPPERIVDYLTLIGDSSDNIPGVPKVGPKTAAKWLAEYESLDHLVTQADQLSGKVGEYFRAFIPQIPLTRLLVTIKQDVPLDQPLALTRQPVDKETLLAIYKEMEFKNWLSDLLSEKKSTDTMCDYTLITTDIALQQWIATLKEDGLFSLAIGTTSTDYMVAKIVSLALARQSGETAYIALGEAQTTSLSALKTLLEDDRVEKIGHDFKYMIEVLARYDITLKGTLYDVMLISYLQNSASNKHEISSLALKYLGKNTISYEEIAGKASKEIPFNEIPLTKAASYLTEYADIIRQLYAVLWPMLCKEPGLQYVFEKIETPLISVLAHIERTGVRVDPDILKIQGEAMSLRVEELEKEIYAQAGSTFNINSPKQLQEVLFEKLKLPALEKTPTGQPSTADHVLQDLALDFAIPRLLIEYRSLSKLLSTYINKLPLQINPTTQRIHTTYHQTGTSTGRLSSSEPNLQNIPIRSIEGRRIRQAFVASPGCKMISADYSQIELRLIAHISEDPNLLKAFSNQLDIHKATAAEVAGIDITEVTTEMRRDAKAVNFGLIYGMSAFGLARQLNIDKKAAQDYIDRYFARYPRVKAYMDNTREMVKEKGFVETLWGRRLYLPDIHASQIPRQKAAERAAINAPLQGSAADIIKLAMIDIDHWFRTANIQAKMIMQVHDELVFEVNAADVAQITEGIRYRMENVVKLHVPVPISVGIGDNWDTASEHG
ncbi:MAG TPA: DNA polymerase I [Gammaproteobacteria bacterium]|jgi:DNA polymerase-1|nr:DNA polymerase I [Gammaproteobacteria bacterium]